MFQCDGSFWVVFAHQFFIKFFGDDYVLDAVGEHFFGVVRPRIGGFFGGGSFEFSKAITPRFEAVGTIEFTGQLACAKKAIVAVFDISINQAG